MPASQPHPATTARHAVIDEALSSTGAYVEHYGRIDFVGDTDALVYAWRVEDAARRPLGVLVLVFRLADEMEGIYRKLLPENDWTVLGCVTPDGHIVAGSCPIQLPVGLKISSAALSGRDPVLRLAARQYLAMACRPSGYQGYMGPGWIGLGLVPLEGAFDQGEGELGAGDRRGASRLGDEPLRPILRGAPHRLAPGGDDPERPQPLGPGTARSGRPARPRPMRPSPRSCSGRSPALAARRNRSAMPRSATCSARSWRRSWEKCRSCAAFAIDVMDRNLYERANDCRWWALNATFARVLAGPSAEGAKTCADILATINLALYRLQQSDPVRRQWPRHCRIAALRGASGRAGAGGRMGPAHAVPALGPALRRLRPLSRAISMAALSTLIYTAAVQGEGTGRAIGGIAIVFDLDPAIRRDPEGCPAGG